MGSQNHTNSSTRDTTQLRLHRGHIFDELLVAFETDFHIEDAKVEIILPDGTTESAEDSTGRTGSLRDAFSEFWEDFYERCTTGTGLKLPCLSHDFGETRWQSVARILIEGYELFGYFPVKISPVLIKACFGIQISNVQIYNDFLHVIPECDALLLKEAVQDISKVDNDELIEFLGSYNSRQIPKQENIEVILQGIAHAEIIQKSAYIRSCFSNIFKKKLIDENKIDSLYDKLQPSVKNCLNNLKSKENESNLNSREFETFAFLRRFIKESDEKTRQAFLRFCTGSDLPTVEITVEFNTLNRNRLTHRQIPIAYTWSGLLQIPTYGSFPALRSELNRMLTSNIWVMG